jgi:FixJ family two-component response regulator
MTSLSIGSAVAVLDDDPEVVELLRSMLTSLGVVVHPYLTAKALLADMNTQTFAAITIDLGMPDSDGFELLAPLAMASPKQPILIVSGHDNNIIHAAQIIAQGYGLEVIGALSKPVRINTLARALGLPIQA